MKSALCRACFDEAVPPVPLPISLVVTNVVTLLLFLGEEAYDNNDSERGSKVEKGEESSAVMFKRKS